MKQNKIILLGIAIILFGIACSVMLIGHNMPTIIEWLGNITPFIGLGITIIGFFIKE